MSEEDFFNGAILGSEDVLILRSREPLRDDVLGRIEERFAQLGLNDRVLIVDGSVMEVGILHREVSA